MSKMVIYVLDKVVWMMVVTVITTQALQIAGVVDAPKGLGEIELSHDKQYEFQLGVDVGDIRGKRQTDDKLPLIDNIFNIPISTLNAVSQLLKSAAPLVQRIRENAANRKVDSDGANIPTVTSQRRHRLQGRRNGPADKGDLLDTVDAI